MSCYVIYSNSVAKTAKLIRDLLECKGGMNPPPQPVDFIINYGSGEECKGLYKHIFNDPAAIRVNSNKGKSIRQLLHSGVQAPEIYSPEEIQHNLDAMPVIGRMSTHKSGSGFYLCLNKSDVIEAINKGCSHFLRFFPTEREFRTHIFDGVCIRLQEKVKIDKDASKYIRTHSKGWAFATKNQNRDNIPDGVIDQGIKAVRAMGFVFGAVDIGVDYAGRVKVFEVNSGASLDEEGQGIIKFVSEVRKYMEKKK